VRHLLVVLALFGAGLVPAHADSPAQMFSGKRSIEQLLRIPRGLKPGRYTLHCGVLIGTSGWVLFARCYPPTTDYAPRALYKAATYAARSTLFVPATRSGKKVEVYATLTVKVDTTRSDPLIQSAPNDGADAEKYGALYTAPQRYGGSHVNPPIRPLHNPRRAAVVWMKLQIDEQGQMTSSTVINNTDAPAWWVDAVNDAAKQMTFIPGYHEGKPVPMQFVQPMLWRY
jgi:hypothetical protein